MQFGLDGCENMDGIHHVVPLPLHSTANKTNGDVIQVCRAYVHIYLRSARVTYFSQTGPSRANTL